MPKARNFEGSSRSTELTVGQTYIAYNLHKKHWSDVTLSEFEKDFYLQLSRNSIVRYNVENVRRNYISRALINALYLAV